jgi:hypothetical protein
MPCLCLFPYIFLPQSLHGPPLVQQGSRQRAYGEFSAVERSCLLATVLVSLRDNDIFNNKTQGMFILHCVFFTVHYLSAKMMLSPAYSHAVVLRQYEA